MLPGSPLLKLSLVRCGSLPFTYLGVPVFLGKPRKVHLQPIADKIKCKLSSWKGSAWSFMGMVQLVKSIIQGMLVYSFHVYMWLVSLLKSLDKCIRNFIWTDNVNKRKLVAVAWSNMCQPTVSGGLGLRSLRSINEAALLKLSWDMLSSNDHWSVLLKSRFMKFNRPLGHYVKSSIWPGVRQFINTTVDGYCWQLGDGKQINFWRDCRLDSSIADMLHLQDSMLPKLLSSVSDFIHNGS